jgi:hypothetical protein
MGMEEQKASATHEQEQEQQQQEQEQEQARREYQECWEAGQAIVFSILSVFGQAYHLLCQFQCTECIRHLQLLPRRHFSCGWVQYTLGKAYFELNDYKVSIVLVCLVMFNANNHMALSNNDHYMLY